MPTPGRRSSRGAAVVQAAAAGRRRRSTASTPASASSRPARASASDELAALQRNLIRSRTASASARRWPPPVVRLMLAMKAASAGARLLRRAAESVVQSILLTRSQRRPRAAMCPAQGSVGASGDLAPLSHMTLALMGEGEMLVDGHRRIAARSTRTASQGRPQAPLVLRSQGRPGADQRHADLHGARSGSACCIFETGAGRRRRRQRRADAWTPHAAATVPSIPRIHEVRGQPGQIETAAAFITAHCSSRQRRSARAHRRRRRSRAGSRTACAASRRSWAPAWTSFALRARLVLLREANAVTDNPLVFAPEDGPAAMVSGGNFHAEPVALACRRAWPARSPKSARSPSAASAMLIDTGVSRSAARS